MKRLLFTLLLALVNQSLATPADNGKGVVRVERKTKTEEATNSSGNSGTKNGMYGDGSFTDILESSEEQDQEAAEKFMLAVLTYICSLECEEEKGYAQISCMSKCLNSFLDLLHGDR